MKVKPFLLIGIGVILVSVISWFSFPAWAERPGGLFQLLGVVALGVLSAVTDLVSIWKDTHEPKKTSAIQQTNQLADKIQQTGDGINITATEISIDQLGGSRTIIEHADQVVIGGKEEKETALPQLPSRGQIPEPGELPPGSRLSHLRNAVFTGRENDLLKLADTLLHADRAGKMSVSQTAAATGLGGIGKTQLAVEFCYRYGRFYEGVHWISATVGDVAVEIAECGRLMGLQPWPETTPDQAASTLHAWSKSQRRLVVIDNAEDLDVLQDWLPKIYACHVLITSRRSYWPADLGLRECKLGVLSRFESLELLRKLAPRLQNLTDNTLVPIAEKLGDLPLALHLAGCYLKDRERLSPQSFLGELEKQENLLDHAALLDWSERTPTVHEVSMAATFQMSWTNLRSRGAVDTLARKIFQIAGWCAPNAAIPFVLLLHAAGIKEGSPQEATFDCALNRLHESGLLDRTDSGPMIHPLLAAFSRITIQKKIIKSVLEPLADAQLGIAEKAFDTGYPLVFMPLRAHLEKICAEAEKANLKNSSALWGILGLHLENVAEYNQAKVCLERALKIDEQFYGNEHQEVAEDLNNLGNVLGRLGDLKGAKACFERALKIVVEVSGADHPDAAVYYGGLGLIQRDLGDLAGAKACLEKALNIDKRHYGSNHTEVASAYYNLGDILAKMGDLQGAKTYFEQALKIDMTVYGGGHPDVATDVCSLGEVLHSLGELEEARSCFERALHIDESVYGAEHPHVARDVNYLGLLLRDLGDLEGAKVCFEHTLKIANRVGGGDHPDVAAACINLGILLSDLGDLAGAKVNTERALKIEEQVFGENHPNVARTLNNLGMVQYKLGDLQGAKTYLDRALTISECYSDDHLNIALIATNLGMILRDLGDFQSAKAFFERALKIDEEIYGADHAIVAVCANNLGTVLQALGDFSRAKACIIRALAIIENTLPADHPNVKIVRENLKNMGK